MIKTKSFFLLILFSLFALNSHGRDHKNCERKRYLPEMLAKTVMIGFILAHISPLFQSISNSWSFILMKKQLLHMSLTDVDRNMIQSKSLPSILKTVQGELINAKKVFSIRSKNAPMYILAVAFAQALTALMAKPMF
jgi:hypothetical protein